METGGDLGAKSTTIRAKSSKGREASPHKNFGGVVKKWGPLHETITLLFCFVLDPINWSKSSSGQQLGNKTNHVSCWGVGKALARHVDMVLGVLTTLTMGWRVGACWEGSGGWALAGAHFLFLSWLANQSRPSYSPSPLVAQVAWMYQLR